jgi:Carboxypeptidase regulatory-like domain
MNNLTSASATVVVSFAILLSACNDGATIPTSPTTTAPTPTATVTYILSGAVSEMTATGPAPIEGARVDAGSGLSATTDAGGLYRIPGLPATSRSISVTRGGYVTQTKTVTMSGDTLLDIRLDRIVSYTLSGVVFEMTEAGQVPVEGVSIYCDSCGSPDGHTFVDTDANGFYSLSWTTNGIHTLFVKKAGFEVLDPAGSLRGAINATVRGDTRFDIQLARR